MNTNVILLLKLLGFTLLLNCANPQKKQAKYVSPDCLALTSDFPANFTSGAILFGMDCEEIVFLPDGTFYYRFDGDCHSQGRYLLGNWVKEPKKISIKAAFEENDKEGKAHCSTLHRDGHIPAKFAKCFKKYKSGNLERYGVYPIKLSVTGEVGINPEMTPYIDLSSAVMPEYRAKNREGELRIPRETVQCLYPVEKSVYWSIKHGGGKNQEAEAGHQH